MKLYGYWRSSSTWRVRIALAHKGLPFDYEAVHLLREGGEQNTERYRSLNPTGTVPLLELDSGWRVSQSMAILELLEELHPAPPLLPREPRLRARARQLAELLNSGVQPLHNLAVLNRVKESLHADERAWAQHWISRGLAAFDAEVASCGGRFCVGDGITFADVYLIPQLHAARRFGAEVSPYPRLLEIEKRCEVLPAFQAAHADRQPDTPPVG